jgi:hypothetical protein
MAQTVTHWNDWTRVEGGYPFSTTFQDNAIDQTDVTGANAHIYLLNPKCIWFSASLINKSSGGTQKLQATNDSIQQIISGTAEWFDILPSVVAGATGFYGNVFLFTAIRSIMAIAGTAAPCKLHMMMSSGNAQT